jgi:adenosyl cobinamide kinase/adenosyl cobinamide phosphate guanylyltransferase
MRLGRGLSLLIGGARSGKSDLAVQLGKAWPGTVTFIATATAGDADMTERISQLAGHLSSHPTSRPALLRVSLVMILSSSTA